MIDRVRRGTGLLIDKDLLCRTHAIRLVYDGILNSTLLLHGAFDEAYLAWTFRVSR